MMAHACLMRIACVTLVGEDKTQNIDTTLRAARHARQMQDIIHATELYLQVNSLVFLLAFSNGNDILFSSS